MPYTKPLSVLLILALFFLSCKKDPVVTTNNSTPPHDSTVAPAPVPTLHMSLSYLLQKHTYDSNFRSNYEIFVSEPGGKVLYDTVLDYNKTAIANLYTSATLLDVSVIYAVTYSASLKQFWVYTYKSVDLASWKNVPLSDSMPGQVYPVVTGTATMQLKNVAIPGSFLWQFMSNDDNGPNQLPASGPYFSPQNVSNTSNVTVSYPWEQDKYAYIAFPYNALYKLHKINGQTDTVDLSQLDTAKTISLNWPAQYDIMPEIWGYQDATDLTHPLLIAPGHGQYTHAYTYEAMYPANKQVFQKYDVKLTGYPTIFPAPITAQPSIRWTNLDTIPVNVPFFDNSYYAVNYKTPDSFAVAFPKTKPTFYTFAAQFGGGNNFDLTVPGDSTAIDPERTLAILVKGKLLQGLSPAMFINGFVFTVDDEPNYQNYFRKQADATAALKRPQSNQNSLTVALGNAGGAEVTKFFQRMATSKR
jgi:hypothetical protein